MLLINADIRFGGRCVRGGHAGWDVGRADSVTMTQGGESGDVSTNQSTESLGFRVAELREILGDVGNRTVVLTQLNAEFA